MKKTRSACDQCILDLIQAYVGGDVSRKSIVRLLEKSGWREAKGWHTKSLGKVSPDLEERYGVYLAQGKLLYCFRKSGDYYLSWGYNVYHISGTLKKLSVAEDRYLAIVEHRNARGREQKKIIWGDEEYPDYDAVYSVSIEGGKPLYGAVKNNQECVVWGDEELAYSHKELPLSLTHGKHLRVVDNPKKLRAMPKCCVKWGDVEYKTYERIYNLSFVQDKPLYCAVRKRYREHLVVWGEVEYQPYSWIGDLQIAQGKPLYRTYRDKRHFVVWGDETYEEFNGVSDVTEALGEPLYVAQQNERQFVVWGKKKHREFDKIAHLSFAQGKPLYAANERNRWFVLWGDEVQGSAHHEIQSLTCLKGKPFFLAKYVGEQYRKYDHDKQYLVWGEKKYREYDAIYSLQVQDGLISFLGRIGFHLYHITRKIGI